MKQTNTIYRHGDISLHEIKEKASGEIIKHDGTYILALGEVTGHKHLISVTDLNDMEIIKLANGGIILRLMSPGTLTHEEHKTLTIPTGDYLVRNEREFDYFSNSVRRVVD